MSDKLFSIGCETCNSRLAVRDANLIGHILSCPKCGSMVMVQPPPGWTLPANTVIVSALTSAEASPPITDQPLSDSMVATTQASVAQSAPTPSPPSPPASVVPSAKAAIHNAPRDPGLTTLQRRWSESVDAQVPAANAAIAPPPVDVPLTAQDWLSPSQRLLRRWGSTTLAALGGVAVAVAVWYFVAPGDDTHDESEQNQVAANADGKRESSGELKPGETKTSTAKSPAPRAPEPDALGSSPNDAPGVAVSQVVPSKAPDTPTPPSTPAVDAAKNPAIANDKKAETNTGAGEPPSEQPPATAEATPAANGAPNVAAKPAREPLPTIDVAARLNDRITKLDFPKTRLCDYLAVLSSYSTIPITFDIDSMLAAGVRPETSIVVRASNKTVSEALDAALGPLKLRAVAVDQHLIVTVREADDVAQAVRRDVSDLVAIEAGASEAAKTELLATRIKRLVEPLSWQTEKTKSLRAEGTTLVIVQSPRVVRKIDAYLTRLREMRRDPAGAATNTPAAVQTRYSLARSALAKTITANFTTPTPLAKILARLRTEAKVSILVDWQALAADEVGPATLATLSATKVPVENALAALVGPLDLACRVVDEQTVEITTENELASRGELEAYPAADLVAAGVSMESIAQGLQAQFGPARGDNAVAWHVDTASQTLFLLAPQDVHIQLEKALRAERSKRLSSK